MTSFTRGVTRLPRRSGRGARFAQGTLWDVSARKSFRLDVCRPDHLAPLLNFFGDELAEIGR
jgi:hypothetical protein